MSEKKVISVEPVTSFTPINKNQNIIPEGIVFAFSNTGTVTATINGYTLNPGDKIGDDSSQLIATLMITNPELKVTRKTGYDIVFPEDSTPTGVLKKEIFLIQTKFKITRG